MSLNPPVSVFSPPYASLFRRTKATSRLKLQEIGQFGQPLVDPATTATARPVVPRRQANKISLVSHTTATVDTGNNIKRTEPLSVAKRTSRPQTPQTASKLDHRLSEPRALRNRFDHPLTQREVEQLKFKLLRGDGDGGRASSALAVLLQQTHDLLEQLQQRGVPGKTTKAEPADGEHAPPTANISPAPAQLISDDDDAAVDEEQQVRDDLRTLEQDYPLLAVDEQKELVAAMRRRHGLRVNANLREIARRLREKLST